MLTVRTFPRAQFNVSTLEVNFAFHKLDAPRIMVLTIMACALVVSSNRRLNFLVRSYKNMSIGPIAAYDERACHNGWYHNSRRIELVKHGKPQALKR